MRNLLEVAINNLESIIVESHNKVLDETLSCKQSAGEWIKDFQKSSDTRFKGDSKEKRKQKALAARYAKCEESELTENKVGVPVRNALIMLLSAGLSEGDLQDVFNIINNKSGITDMDTVTKIAKQYGLSLGRNLFEVTDEEPLYVEYIREMSGEPVFRMNDGRRYQYVWSKYPNDKEDIGVYCYDIDLVYSYPAFKSMFNIN